MRKSVVITGGNKGLGFKQSQTFLEAGYDVHIIARTEGQLSELQDLGSDADVHFHACDLSSGEAPEVLAEIAGKTPHISALVNNAGVHLKKPVWEVSDHELDHVLHINLKVVFALSGAYIRLNEQQGGAIVNVSSMAGLLGLPGAAAYVASKTAVIGLTRSVAVDAAQMGIRCNAVCPGFIETDMTRAILAKDPERRRRIENRIPTHAFGDAQDVAEACLFLASDKSKYINGVALPVDAGFSIGF